ncbi:DUF4389 domain-containing protein [Bermanella marisrubri]|uniref:Lipase n=1 Tax=Bermanella marisrubri TaxID=207949 RepID=Q1N0N2_9GAMM|nr:DUF4389 domain-containing protein [Bermanella marisrubri]EAT11801.1 hypothetical protein RED65_05424 [Oceanobacter sp. RED65] [Bermanella marisrubri]QIZ83836.1 DUF4389 domain-containing protein [Bermanella marisrubri]
MDKTWKDNIKSESFWLRSLFMVLFFVVYRIVDILVLLVAICQWLYVLLTGDNNASLSRFAGGLAAYVAQIVNYLSYNSEQKPFPFSDWPEPESNNGSRAKKTTSAKTSKAKKTSRKTSVKKSSSKKTSAKTATENDVKKSSDAE